MFLCRRMCGFSKEGRLVQPPIWLAKPLKTLLPYFGGENYEFKSLHESAGC